MRPSERCPIVIVGTSPRAFALAATLSENGWEVAVLARLTATPPPFERHQNERHWTERRRTEWHPTASQAKPLVIVELGDRASLGRLLDDSASISPDRADGEATPTWIAWLDAAAPHRRIGEAYAAGALAVFPATTTHSVLVATVGRLANHLSTRPERAPERRPSPPAPLLRRHRAGSNIDVRDDHILLVRRGVVAQYTWHEDGSEGLLGLWGPRQAILGHPNDSCCLALRAHTDVEVEIHDGSIVADRPEIVDLLRQRTLRLESWASMQARPSVEQQLVGILRWLGEQFGRSEPEGTVIEVRITHAQLAAAIGATRATVTRILGILRRRQVIALKATADGERLLICDSERFDHPLRSAVGIGA